MGAVVSPAIGVNIRPIEVFLQFQWQSIKLHRYLSIRNGRRSLA